MKAVIFKKPGNPAVLELGEASLPHLRPHDVLFEMRAASVNRADLLQREGKYPPPPGASDILGLDAAGVVVKVGAAVTKWKVGDKIMSLLSGGGYAEFVATHEDLAMKVPSSLSFEKAAAIPEVFLTAFQTLFLIGKLEKGMWVLVHAAGSGVGTAALQLIKQAGAHALITAGSQEKIAACLKLGAHAGFNYKEGPFLPHVLENTKGKGVSLILDFIGAPYFEQNIESLAQDGTLVMIATMGGARIESFNLRKLFEKRASLSATHLRNRSEKYKISLTQAFSNFALPLFEIGKLKPIISQVFPWEKAGEAHQFLETQKNIGKVILIRGTLS